MSTSTLMTDAVTVYVDAPPETVWALVSDPTRIGEFSPGTHVTESFAVSGGAFVGLYAKVFGKARTRTNVRGMQATLARMKAVAEA